MPLARIRTRFPEKVSEVSTTLTAAGYTVETAHPDEFKSRQADVELWIDEPFVATSTAPEPTVFPDSVPDPSVANSIPPVVPGRLNVFAQRLSHAIYTLATAWISAVEKAYAVRPKGRLVAPSSERTPLSADSVPAQPTVVVEEIVQIPPARPVPAIENPLPDIVAQPEPAALASSATAQHRGASIALTLRSCLQWLSSSISAMVRAVASALRNIGRTASETWSHLRHARAWARNAAPVHRPQASPSRVVPPSSRSWTRRERDWMVSGVAAGMLACGFALGWSAALHSHHPSAIGSAGEAVPAAVTSPAPAPATHMASDSTEPLRPSQPKSAQLASAPLAAVTATPTVVSTKAKPAATVKPARTRRIAIDDSVDDVVVIHYPIRKPAPPPLRRATYQIPHYSDMQ